MRSRSGTPERERSVEAGATQKAGWIRRLIGWIRPHRRDAIVAFSVAIVGTAIAAFAPLVEKVIVDDVISDPSRPLWPWLLLLVGFGISRFGLAFVRRYRGGRIALAVQHDLRTAIFRQLQRLDFASHDAMQTGQLVSRAGSDIMLIQGLLQFLPIAIGQRPDVPDLARDHGHAVAAAHGRDAARHPRAALDRAATPHRDLSRELGRATARRRGRDGRRGVRHRSADRQGIRPGATSARSARRTAPAACSAPGCASCACRRACSHSSRPFLPLGMVAVLALGGWLALDDQISLGRVPRVLELHARSRRAGADVREHAHDRAAGAGRCRTHLRAARQHTARAGAA